MTDLAAHSDRPVEQRSDLYVEQAAALDPLLATEVGIGGYDHLLTDYSPAGYDARASLARSALADVAALTPSDDREAAAQAAFIERTEVEVAYDEAGFARSLVNVIASPVQGLRGAFDLMPTDTEADWENIHARLAAIPTCLAGLQETWRVEAARGNVSAARQYAAVAHQIQRWVGGTSTVFDDLVAGAEPTVTASLAAALRTAAAEAARAYAATADVLADELAPQGREVDAVGEEHYALASRISLGTQIDLAETYAWGWQELDRIEREMAATAARITPDAAGLATSAAIAAAVAHLENDPARRIEGGEAFRDWMQELADRAVRELADVHFDIPDPVRRIACALAPTNDGGIYYSGPSEDFSRPGTMWWSVPEGVDVFYPWQQTTTVFHEGVPGHHLQIGQATHQAALLNRWQRHLCWVSGHGEGWALYAERLMEELGYLDDPADRLGMLDGQALRAARVVVDIGMHLRYEIPADNPLGFAPGERWTPELGGAFLRAHTRESDETLAFELERYLGWPGQAPSYKIGERVWLEMRAEAQRRHGDAFDLKAFHRAALDLGSMGLDPLREALGRL